MVQSTDYVTVKADKKSRSRARVTKAKLGITGSEFLDRAADELDPDDQTDD